MPRGVGVRLPEWPFTSELPSRNTCNGDRNLLIGELITSPSNARLKQIANLREPKNRRRDHLMLIDGPQLIDIAIGAGFRCKEVLLKDPAWKNPSREMASLLRHMDQPRIGQAEQIRWTPVATAAMERVQYGQQNVDAIAIAEIPDTSLDIFDEDKDFQSATLSKPLPKTLSGDIYLVLDRLEKPGNLGAALRTADAAGVRGVLLCDPICETWNPNAIRASMGAIFTVPIAIGDQDSLWTWFKARGIQCFAARVEDGNSCYETRFNSSTAIIIGNEAQGLEDRWKQSGVHSIHIPMLGKIDSLNASVSGALLLFEIVRQMRLGR